MQSPTTQELFKGFGQMLERKVKGAAFTPGTTKRLEESTCTECQKVFSHPLVNGLCISCWPAASARRAELYDCETPPVEILADTPEESPIKHPALPPLPDLPLSAPEFKDFEVATQVNKQNQRAYLDSKLKKLPAPKPVRAFAPGTVLSYLGPPFPAHSDRHTRHTWWRPISPLNIGLPKLRDASTQTDDAFFDDTSSVSSSDASTQTQPHAESSADEGERWAACCEYRWLCVRPTRSCV